MYKKIIRSAPGRQGLPSVLFTTLSFRVATGTSTYSTIHGQRKEKQTSLTCSSMSSDFPHYNFRMPNIGFQNLPLNIYIVVFGTAIFVFILSLLFCCYLIRLRHQAHKEFYAYKQVILKEKVKELNLHELCAVCLEDFKPRDELGICPCKHAFHRKCLIKWLEVRKVCPLCNMPVLQLAQLHSKQDRGPPQGPLPGAENIV
ncbi:RING finger protein 24 isoform X1 [Ursus arctos]|uniref:RING finger protein 24 isoform X1 n=1 Tax=Ursus arctos TaxID=9644 RepID=UPI0020181008|nr:RING finger protein 24 isoform X1 [Ursus arctos]